MKSHMLHRARYIAVLAVAALGCMMVPTKSAADISKVSASFPLWKDVPVHDFTVLHEGRSPRGTRWGVYVFNRLGGGRVSGKRPCILLATYTKEREYGYSVECGSLAPSAGVAVPPITVGSGSARLSSAEGKAGESFWAMTLDPSVIVVDVDTEPEGHVIRYSHYLSLRQARKAHVRRFRYVFVALAKDVCLGEVTGRDATGAVVLKSDFDECSL